MGHLVLIGGGNNGGRGTDYETGAIDAKIKELTGKSAPHFLFLGFATTCPDSYFRAIKRNFKALGCTVAQLTKKDLLDSDTVQQKLSAADIIYLGGGNTLRLTRTLRKYGLDGIIRREYASGKVISGISAGAIAISRFGLSDVRKNDDGSGKYVRVKGLDLLPVLFCPHYNTQPARQNDLPRMLKRTPRLCAVTADDGAALVVSDTTVQAVNALPNAGVCRYWYQKGELFCFPLFEDEQYPLSDFLE